MSAATLSTKVAQPFCPVKSINSQLPLFSPGTMIHHKVRGSYVVILYRDRSHYRGKPYGVSSSQRVLSPGLFIKRFDYIRDCLQYVIGLSVAQREVTLRLLRLWAYYGKAYPKESQVTELPGCSKATYWRTIKLLEELALVTVVNRYVIRPHAQISNLYRLDRLLIVIARYLAEHGVAFLEKWLAPYLQLPGRVFWGSLAPCQESRAGPFVSGPPLCLTS